MSRPELVEVEDEGLLPLVARLDADPLRLLIKAGRVGGPEGERGSLAIGSAEREAALEAAQAPDAIWERDPDFGVDLLVSPVQGIDQGLLVPRFLYRRADRFYEYAAAMPEARRKLAAISRR